MRVEENIVNIRVKNTKQHKLLDKINGKRGLIWV